jgi:hypothetical protein
MLRKIGFLGAVVAVFMAVGCGPLDQDELSQQTEGMKATPILMSASCPASNTCGAEFDKCSEWSSPAGCGASACTVVQYQTCVDSRGNQCINVAVSPASADGCN